MDYYDFEVGDHVDYDVPSPGKPCVFDEPVMPACLLWSDGDPDAEKQGYFWCYTDYYGGEGWGLCEPDCPKGVWARSPPSFEWKFAEIVFKK